jgi:hypothetical protein
MRESLVPLIITSTTTPTIATLIAIPVTKYVAYRVARAAVERSRERERKKQSLRRAVVFMAEGSTNPIIKKGWPWIDIDPAAKITRGKDSDRKVAAYLKLARMLSTSKEGMRELEHERIKRFESYSIPAVVSKRRYRPEVEELGGLLIRYPVELAIDDHEADRAVERFEKAGIDPYTLPRELAEIDELMKRYRRVTVDGRGFRYANEDKRKFEKCPHCGGKMLKGSKYCTSCGTALRARAGITLPKLQLHKPHPMVERKCLSCGMNLLPGAKRSTAIDAG